MPRVAGIDPSLTSTGVVLVEAGRVVETHRIRTSSSTPMPERMDWIAQQIATITEGCDYVGIEGVAMGAKGSAVAQIYGLWWVIRTELHRAGREVYVIAPSQRIKLALGTGRGEKDAVLAAVVKRYADVDVTGNDIADALLVAEAGATHYGDPIAALPAENRKALEKVEWPR